MPLLPHQQLARDVFRQLVEIDTTTSTAAAAAAMASRLAHGGLAEVEVIGPEPDKLNLVARLRGTGERPPILLLAHLDVVEARPEEWSVDPFTLLERDGHFYGRGTTDDKAMAAIWVANLVRMRRDGFTPDRDIILALTADEEGGEHNGAEWLLRNRRELVDAAFGLNEGGYGRSKAGRRISNTVQASEKLYLDLVVEATGRPGHSSLPSEDNAIYHLAAALERLRRHRFPVRLSEITRAFFHKMSGLESEPVAADMRAMLRTPPDPDAAERLSAIPHYNGLLRTTCVPTRLEAGQTNNTVPRTARAVVNCRLLPEQSPEEVLRALEEAIGDARVRLIPLAMPEPAPPSPLTREILDPVERITEQLWPGVPVVPAMGIGGTDSRHFRAAGIPMYGVSGIFLDVDDVRAHAPDERIGVEAFFQGQDFLDRLVRALCSASREV